MAETSPSLAVSGTGLVESVRNWPKGGPGFAQETRCNRSVWVRGSRIFLWTVPATNVRAVSGRIRPISWATPHLRSSGSFLRPPRKPPLSSGSSAGRHPRHRADARRRAGPQESHSDAQLHEAALVSAATAVGAAARKAVEAAFAELRPALLEAVSQQLSRRGQGSRCRPLSPPPLQDTQRGAHGQAKPRKLQDSGVGELVLRGRSDSFRLS